MWRIRVLAAVVLTSCGGGKSTPTPTPGPVTPPVALDPSDSLGEWIASVVPSPAPPGVLYGTGIAATREEARQLATAELDRKFWADYEWPMLPPEVALFELDAPELFAGAEVQELEADGQFAVVLNVSGASIAGIARSSIEAQEPTLAAYRDSDRGFGALIPTLHLLWAAEAELRVCDRLKALAAETAAQPVDGRVVDSNCDAEHSKRNEAQAASTRIIESLLLEPRLDGGVPVGPDGKPFRPLEVLVTWTDGESDAVAAPGVPLKVTDGFDWIGQHQSRSGASGVASFDFGDVLPNPDTRIGLELDREAWAGNVAELLPELALSMPFRRVTPSSARVGLLIQEEWGDGMSRHLASALQSGLATARGADVQVLDDVSAAIVTAITPKTLGDLAEATRGRIDVLVAGKATSALASRMGSRSVYHEASAALTLFDVWTGAEITTVERSTQALGLGDARAAKNALTQLGGELVEFVNVALKRPVALGPR